MAVMVAAVAAVIVVQKTALVCFCVLYCVGFRYFPPAATFPSSVQVGPCHPARHPDNLHLPIAEIGHFLPLTPNLLQYALRM